MSQLQTVNLLPEVSDIAAVSRQERRQLKSLVSCLSSIDGRDSNPGQVQRPKRRVR